MPSLVSHLLVIFMSGDSFGKRRPSFSCIRRCRQKINQDNRQKGFVCDLFSSSFVFVCFSNCQVDQFELASITTWPWRWLKQKETFWRTNAARVWSWQGTPALSLSFERLRLVGLRPIPINRLVWPPCKTIAVEIVLVAVVDWSGSVAGSLLQPHTHTSCRKSLTVFSLLPVHHCISIWLRFGCVCFGLTHLRSFPSIFRWIWSTKFDVTCHSTFGSCVSVLLVTLCYQDKLSFATSLSFSLPRHLLPNSQPLVTN